MIVAFTFKSFGVKAEELTNYYGIEITANEYNNLINLGFTEDEIYYMDQTTFDANSDIESTLLAKTIKYYKTVYPLYGNSYTEEVTEDEYFNHKIDNQLRTTVSDSYKTVVSTISANGGNSFRYKVSTTWSSIPGNRSYDIIGIGISSNTSISSSVYYYHRYADSNGNFTTSYTYSNRKSTATGGAVVYHLPTGNITSLGATLYFDVNRTSGTTISSCGDYSHAISNVSSSNIADYVINIGGISLGPTLMGYYDAIPCALSYAS